MIGNFDDVAPRRSRSGGRPSFGGWALDDVDPRSMVDLQSAGSSYTTLPGGAIALARHLHPSRRRHTDRQ